MAKKDKEVPRWRACAYRMARQEDRESNWLKNIPTDPFLLGKPWK